jgi:anti-sigma regulatory factor (Ser/Thr protein kinase)/anti-anti-sigma regulatory factor
MPKQTEEIRKFILENVEDHPSDITSLVAGTFDISRQASHRYVQKLVSDGLVIAEGNTRDRKYEVKPLFNYSTQLSLKGLEEDKVWRQNVLPLMQNVSPNVLQICHHGLTEMVNNAIDHSKGSNLKIKIRRTYKLIELQIIDDGIGIFNKIRNELGLDDPLHAILELSKGKLTTDPAHHSGEGIFFTSRMFDTFSIFSGKLFFSYSERSGDWLIEDDEKLISGTRVVLSINTNARTTTQQVFDKFTGDDFGFTKTHVPVFLARYGDENLVSRSQAKRLLTRFERFKEIVLDFENVDSIGQAFADEIFRVFASQNPNVHLIPVNTNEQVEKMIAHVKNAI